MPAMTTATPSSQALVKQQSDMELMPPPPPPKRIKRPAKVLDEDDYTDALSHIIARDFFPGLLETQVQQDYLDALESNNQEWIANAGRRLAEAMTPGSQHRGRRGVSMTPRMTPTSATGTPRGWVGDTPMSVASDATSRVSSSRPPKTALQDLETMGLAAFQAKYTSEDNESFNKLLDKQNAKKRERYAWMWSGNKIPTARQLAYRKAEAKRLESQKQRSTGNGGEDGDNDKDKQLVLAGTAVSHDDRPARPDTWKSHPENPLMFAPAGIEDTHETLQQKAEAVSRAGPKQVVYQNTRIQPQPTDGAGTSLPPPSPSISAIRDAIAGRPRPISTDPGFTGGETPRVNGYAFVDDDEHDAGDESYHLRLLVSQAAADKTPNPFKLQETRKREALHHRMVDRVARNKRTEKLTQGTKAPVPRFPSSPMIGSRTPGTPSTSLTPAAQRLLANVGTPRRASGRGSGSGSTALKNLWTPASKKGK